MLIRRDFGSKTPLVSFIFPIYNESQNIRLLFKEVSAMTLSQPKFIYEFVFINDGSSDDSLQVLHEIVELDDRVSVIDFSRNFGHQIAVTAGMDHARGDAVIIMDSDLQDPPEVALELIDRWMEGWDVAYAQRRSRDDSVFKRATASIFYRVLQKLSDTHIPENTGDFRLMDRVVVDQVASMRERNRFLRGMVASVGFKQIAVPFDRKARHAGETGYPLRKMIKFATDGIVSFSTAPLRFITHLGVFFSLLSVVGVVYVIVQRMFYPNTTVSGWSFLAIAILLIGGVQLLTLGVIGAYVGRIHDEIKQRPLYIVRSVTSNRND